MASKKPRPRAKEKACDRAIKRTLAYSAVFKYPLSEFQLYTFLITKRKYDYKFFNKSLRRLVKKKHIKAKDGKYYLPGVRPVSWKLRYKYSEELLEEAEKSINLLKTIPWIKTIAVTGATASHNAVKDDDVDVFIITEKNRLWVSRLFVFLILKVVGKYAQGGEHNRKLCCNLFADESGMKWHKNKQNIYVAREMLSMLPLHDKDLTYFKFLKINSWALKYFYNYKVEFPENFPDNKLNKSKFVDLIENVVRRSQLKYMKSKKTTEITTKNFIHFNKHDHSKEILSEYKKNVSNI